MGIEDVDARSGAMVSVAYNDLEGEVMLGRDWVMRMMRLVPRPLAFVVSWLFGS